MTVGGHPAGDRAGPAAGDTWALLDTPIRITCTSGSLAADVAQLFEAFPRAAVAPGAAHRYALVERCEPHGNDRCAHTEAGSVDVSGPPGVALSWLLTAVNHAVLDGVACLAVHAGVVAAGSSVIAFPAPSGTGKTTLTAAGLLAGFAYVSDEALCIEPEGGVRPYPRALALSSWSRRVLRLEGTAAIELDADEAAVPPGRLGAAVPGPPLAVDHIVDLARRPAGTTGPCALTPAGRGDALTWLLRRSFNHYKHPARSFELAADVARGARAWRLEFGDPRAAATLLRERLT